MAATIKQIAVLAGVSRGTVDRALNGRSGVNTEVAKRIRDIAHELAYEPNPVAKALANSKRKVTIGVLINAGGNSFFDKVLEGIHRAMRSVSGYSVTVLMEEMTGYDPNIQLERLDKLAASGLNGLVITPINDKKIIARLSQLAQSGVKITTLNADVSGVDKLCFVGCNYLKSGQTAAELLGQITKGQVDHGQSDHGHCTRVGIITGSFKMLGHNQRVAGFKEVLAADYGGVEVVSVVENNDDNAVSYEVTKKMLIEQRPNALYFCAGGIDGGIAAVKEYGNAGITIITVDDTDNIKSYIREGIVTATVCQQPVKQGNDAIMILYEYLINGKKPPRKHMYTQNEIKLKYNL